MRRSLLSGLAAVAIASLLVGCSDSKPEGPPGELPTVTGEFGEVPGLEFSGGYPEDKLQAKVISEGDGRPVAANDIIVVDYHGQIWDGPQFDTSFDKPAPYVTPIGVNKVIKGWDELLIGQNVGSRVLLSVPAEYGYGDEGVGVIEPGDHLVFVVDIINAFGSGDSGQPDAELDETALAALKVEVTGELGTAPQISIPAGTAGPTEIKTTVIARGSGAPLREGPAALQYAMVSYDGEESFSSWEETTFVPEPNVGVPGDALEQLVGVPAGSRVVIEVPQAGQRRAAALVVDILGQASR